jgi:hypothetical protein
MMIVEERDDDRDKDVGQKDVDMLSPSEDTTSPVKPMELGILKPATVWTKSSLTKFFDDRMELEATPNPSVCAPQSSPSEQATKANCNVQDNAQIANVEGSKSAFKGML